MEDIGSIYSIKIQWSLKITNIQELPLTFIYTLFPTDYNYRERLFSNHKLLIWIKNVQLINRLYIALRI